MKGAIGLLATALFLLSAACVAVLSTRAQFEVVVYNHSWDAKSVVVYCSGQRAGEIHNLSVGRPVVRKTMYGSCYDMQVEVRYLGGGAFNRNDWRSLRVPFPENSYLRVDIGVRPAHNSIWVMSNGT